jgi:hypothetical protein
MEITNGVVASRPRGKFLREDGRVALFRWSFCILYWVYISPSTKLRNPIFLWGTCALVQLSIVKAAQSGTFVWMTGWRSHGHSRKLEKLLRAKDQSQFEDPSHHESGAEGSAVHFILILAMVREFWRTSPISLICFRHLITICVKDLFESPPPFDKFLR